MSFSDSNSGSPDLTLFKKGDEHTFELIFDKYYERLVGFCNQFISDLDKSKSLAQQAFIKLWLNRDKIEQINGITAFLYTAAKTECLNFLRQEKYRYTYQNNALQNREKLLNQEVLESFRFDRLEYQELEEMIQSALDKLPEKCRQVFLKSRFEYKKNHEIAEELGIALKTVEGNITRALKFLRKELQDILPLVMWMF